MVHKNQQETAPPTSIHDNNHLVTQHCENDSKDHSCDGDNIEE